MESGDTGAISKDARDLVGRAARFRLEADALRERAGATDETLIRDQYLALAERWSAFASFLEGEGFARLLDQA